jgi:hypothetical protein
MAGTINKIDSILITKEGTDGNILTNPTIIKICPSAFDLTENIPFEEKDCLTSKGKIMTKGSSTIEGAISILMDAQTLPIILTHVLGEKTSLEDATTDSWAASTVYTKGDIVNHSDGIHSLVAIDVYGDGQSGSTEPSESGRDNNVEWEKVAKLLKYQFEMKDDSPTFRVEYKLSDGANDFYKQFANVEISQLPINVDGESSSYEISLDFKGAKAFDSGSSDWDSNLTSITGATVVDIDRDYYGGECELNIIKIDDTNITLTDSVSMTIDKQLAIKKLLNCETRLTRDLKVQGEIKEEFTIDKYNSYKKRNKFNLKIELKTVSGASVLYEFPEVEGLQTDPALSSRTEVLLSPKLNATSSNSTTPICRATVVAPALISGGAIVGNGAY